MPGRTWLFLLELLSFDKRGSHEPRYYGLGNKVWFGEGYNLHAGTAVVPFPHCLSTRCQLI